MKLEQSFEVAAPLERVWEALVDVQRVAPCLPGASVTSANEDGSYNGTFTIKIGPTTASYAGKLQMETIDEAEHRATMQASGIPWMLPLVLVSGVFISACASSQRRPIFSRFSRSAKCWETPLTVPGAA